MSGSTKVGGGINSMHLSDTAHPFQASGRTPKPKMARTTGMGANPGGEGDKISANAQRGPVKGGINGAGTAK